MSAELSPCRDASLVRSEPLIGTASTIRRWILVERNGPWGRDALANNRFDEEVRRRWRQIGRDNGARVLMIRRHGRYRQHGVRVIVSLSDRQRRWLEELSFDDAEAAVAHDYKPLRRGLSVGGASSDAPRYFVCTHGKHDPCCARHGRKVAAALHEATPDLAWETSHIGGDRFAANVLILPLGFYYGRVAPERAAALMERLRGGEVDLAHFRGRTCYPFDVQAAEWWARKKLGLLDIDGLALDAHERPTKGRSRTRFSLASGGAVTVELALAHEKPALLTCHANREAAAPRYELVNLVRE